ncbi:alkaline phosphatase D family protein [Ascidiimonas sp. W6]|uniref:alkaline phosphatase D family protein n=1 Tax=Ascidiimonas meishanensis TaxID=3128903 RepID=UPI0030ED29B9
MKRFLLILCLMVLGCKSNSSLSTKNNIDSKLPKKSYDFTIAFGSCNNTSLPNNLWDDIQNDHPDVWIWGGDIVYADTDNPEKLKSFYDRQLAIPGYQKIMEKMEVLGTWDDHDYGLNDGGAFFDFKEKSQELFLDFLHVPANDSRRERKGVYHSVEYDLQAGKVKVIVLDTRYFRDNLTDDLESKNRYKPNPYGQGTILGDAQWKWFIEELSSSEADFNIVISSIQLLSDKHGYETWGNFPHEVDKFKSVISKSKAKGVIVLSGDRHISDFSKTSIKGVSYPLIDFTSSGLTHSATNNKGEENPYRVGSLVNKKSYGLLRFNFESRAVIMQMKGDNGEIQQTLKQLY